MGFFTPSAGPYSPFQGTEAAQAPRGERGWAGGSLHPAQPRLEGLDEAKHATSKRCRERRHFDINY